MPVITLPDGSTKPFDHAVTVMQVAESIGAGLAKATLAGVVNDQQVDASFPIEQDASVRIITAKDEEGLDIIRHSTAHLVAQAAKAVFPGVQVTIGPVIEEGFYYDFAYDGTFTLEDLEKIENQMQALVKQALPIHRKVMSRAAAIKLFESQGEKYKVEIIQEIPEDQEISFYQQGDFIDLCRGPHVPDTGKLGAFKLTKLAGAYWRGNPKNPMLQRVYGTAWRNQKELAAYLHRLEEAEKRDHRKIAKAQDLFHFQEEAPGMIFWHGKGWTLYQVIEQYMRAKFREHSYQEIRTPQIVDRTLWEKSGHWDKFGEDMFHLELDKRNYAIKPMNCPCHVQVFNQGLRSYRDLPFRLAEFGSCHRNEASGALHGLLRTRNFTQDDAHIFCTEEQIESEIELFIKMLHEVYEDFGLNKISVKLSTRPEKRVGSDDTWDKAEAALKTVLDRSGLAWSLLPGEGAFYGPKIEFVLEDTIGRRWTTGSVQLDFSMPERLDAEYVGEDSARHTPVMLHRAIFGSLERFIGILIEECEGRFPLWLAPIQAVTMNITENQSDYVAEIVNKLQKMGIRAISDLRNEKIGFKIREHTLQRIPYLLVIGDREVESGTVAVRTLSGEDLGSMSLDALLLKLETEVAMRSKATHLLSCKEKETLVPNK